MTMVIGHPIISGPIALSAGCGLYAACGAGSGGGGLLCALLLGGIGKAYREAHAYRQWAKAWAAASADAAPRRPVKMAHVAMLLVIAGLGAGYAFYPDALRSNAPGVAVLAAMGAAIVAFFRLAIRAVRRFRKRLGTRRFAVTMIARAIAPPPTLATAYRSLPAHCAAILRRRQ